MSKDDQLQPLLDQVGLTGAEADPAGLARLWALVGVDDPQRLDEFLDALVPADEGGDGLPLRVGDWSVDLTATAVRTGVLTALVAGVLIPQGLGEFAVGFVTAVLPSVIEIERIELAASDRRLLIELRAKTDLGSEDQLYAALPPQIRAEINRYDFADFLQRLRHTGLADGPDGGPVRLSAP